MLIVHILCDVCASAIVCSSASPKFRPFGVYVIRTQTHTEPVMQYLNHWLLMFIDETHSGSTTNDQPTDPTTDRQRNDRNDRNY